MLKRKFYDYKELAHVGREYYNDTNFCGVIAVASAAMVPFGLAKKVLERGDLPCGTDMARKPRQGTHWTTIKDALEHLGCSVDAPKSGGENLKLHDYNHPWFGRTVVSIENEKPKGLFLIYVDGHVLFMEDGRINDWSSKENYLAMGYKKGCMRKVQLVWKIERPTV